MTSSTHTVLGYLHSFLSVHRGEQEDRQLLRRFLETRDGDAFAALMQRHGPMVLGLARRVLGDAQMTEDVFQATFLLLARKAKTIRRPESLSCWLHGVAFRLALRSRRVQQRRQQCEANVRPASSRPPLDELTAKELLRVLDEELDQLPPSQRAPLILCCLEGLSLEEAARRLGCSSGAVKGRLERGRQRLRMRLEKRGLTLPAVLGGTLLLGGSTRAVPAALAETTLQAVTAEGYPNPAVAAMIQEMMRMMQVNKLKAIGAALALLVLAGTGVGMMNLHRQAVREETRPATSPDNPPTVQKHVDLHGDPLPRGAVLRLGTLQRRAVNANLAVSADGKSIIGVRSGKSIHVWDAATGELRQTRELPGESLSLSVLSKDGRWLARAGSGRPPLEIWDVQTGQKTRELTIRGKGEVAGIAPFAFSADGRRIAAIADSPPNPGSNGRDLLVRVWALDDGKEIFSRDLHGDQSTSDVLTFAPDGQHLLASFSLINGGLYCWDIATGKLLWHKKDFGAATSPLFLRNGKVLFPAHGPQTLDLVTGKKERIEKLPPRPWYNLTLTPDERLLLLSTAEGVIVWDRLHGKELRTLVGAGEEVVVTPDGKAAITNNGSLQRWDLTTGPPVWASTAELGHLGEVTVVRFSADGKRLVSASTDGTVRLWDTRTGRPLRTWRGHAARRLTGFWSSSPSRGTIMLDVSADGRRVVSAGADEFIKLWDDASDKEVRTISLPPAGPGEPERHFYHVGISPDGRQVAGIFGPYRGMVIVGRPAPKLTDKRALWDAETGKLLQLNAVEKGDGILSPDWHTLVTGNSVIDVRTGKKFAELPDLSPGPVSSGVPSPAFSRDGALIVGQARRTRRHKGNDYYYPDGLGVWEAATGKIIARVKTKSWVGQTFFHPDNRFVVANDLDGIHLLDTRSGEAVARYSMPEAIRASTTPGSYAGCLAFTRDGRRMATGHPDSTILVWDVRQPAISHASLSTKELEACWSDLADADAVKAWQAVDCLAQAPNDALAFLGGRVKPAPSAAADVTGRLLTDLDSDSFAVRQAAAKRLKELGVQAEPALRAALQADPSLEQQQRIQELLAGLREPPPTGKELQQLRALIVLERIGTPQARRLLEEGAKGPQSARLTRQARAALACLP